MQAQNVTRSEERKLRELYDGADRVLVKGLPDICKEMGCRATLIQARTGAGYAGEEGFRLLSFCLSHFFRVDKAG